MSSRRYVVRSAMALGIAAVMSLLAGCAFGPTGPDTTALDKISLEKLLPDTSIVEAQFGDGWVVNEPATKSSFTPGPIDMGSVSDIYAAECVAALTAAAKATVFNEYAVLDYRDPQDHETRWYLFRFASASDAKAYFDASNDSVEACSKPGQVIGDDGIQKLVTKSAVKGARSWDETSDHLDPRSFSQLLYGNLVAETESTQGDGADKMLALQLEKLTGKKQ